MALFQSDRPVSLNAPILVAAFEGWVDAGSAGTLAAGQLIYGSQVVGRFDADRLFDYRARRPTLDVVDGHLQSLEWPELLLRSNRVGERDLLILTGPEPDFRWQALAAEVTRLAQELQVASWISLGAIPVAAPHTRPVTVLATASRPGLLPPGVSQGPAGHLRVPSAVLSVLELGVSAAGIPAIGFFAQVPHYVSAAYPGAAIELLRQVGRFLGEELPVGDLPGRALETRRLLDAATAGDERTTAYVRQLEEATDQARLPEGDDLISDIERFLRGDDGKPGDDGGRLLN
ncbi:MAG: PAC2 family protein [Chloroflexi bacterium]|nr:PAC2 family protein [Chloroflexota bacterium]